MGQELAKTIAGNPWFVLGVSVLAPVGIILSIIFYIKSIRVKRPVCLVHSSSLIRNLSDDFPSLRIAYGSTGVDSLTVSKVAFWNAGRETIDGEDIAEADPLCVAVAEGHSLLEVRVLTESDRANQVKTRRLDSGAACLVSFDYLDRGDGLVLQVVHTGEDSHVQITGTIKGFGKIVSSGLDSYITSATRRAVLKRLLLEGGLLALVVFSSVYLASNQSQHSPLRMAAYSAVGVLIGFAASQSILMHPTLPKKFSRFWE